MDNISVTLSKEQSKTLAREFHTDIKAYCHTNFERFFPWYLNEIRKEKGKPPLKPIEIRWECDHNGRIIIRKNIRRY